MNKHYPLETRKTVLEMYQAGKPVKEISQQTGVSRTHVYEWIKEAIIDTFFSKLKARKYFHLVYLSWKIKR